MSDELLILCSCGGGGIVILDGPVFMGVRCDRCGFEEGADPRRKAAYEARKAYKAAWARRKRAAAKALPS